MTKEQFIENVAKYVKQYAPLYGIKCYSAVISQAILESACGTSELATNANNFFGLKYREGRCPTAIGTYYKVGSEQDANTGQYVSSNMKWFKFSDFPSGIQGYFDFINIGNYKNLKGVTDPRTYLETIKNDGYCTSIKYVQNCLNVIDKYNLTQYDPQPEQKYYRVQVGCFKSEKNAKNLQTKLKTAGFSVIIKQIDGLYKCQMGAFRNKSNAEDLLQSVKSKGFDAFLIYQ